MNLFESIKRLKWYEKIIWFISVMVIFISFFAFKNKEYLTLATSLIGVTALIFVAKGDVLGQLLTVVFAFFYAGNDVVLIILWILASFESISYLPMVLCFIMFLVNDLYGFINWQRMKKKQS